MTEQMNAPQIAPKSSMQDKLNMSCSLDWAILYCNRKNIKGTAR